MQKIALIALLLVIGSAHALAIDGQVLINQSTVTAAGGFPYRITQPGSYKLSGNLVVPAGKDGIDITTSSVVLDLNGFSISTSGNGCGISGFCTFRPLGISFTGFDTIRNGTVSGFFVGVAGTGRGIIEEIQALGNLVGISADNSLARRNNASSNILEGFEGRNSSFLENIANNNVFGFSTFSSSVLQNIANNNADTGFEVSGGLFGSNTALGNVTVAVSLSGGAVSQNNNNCGGATC